MSNDQDQSKTAQEMLAKKARLMWLQANPDMEHIEDLYRSAISSCCCCCSLKSAIQPVASKAGIRRRFCDDESGDEKHSAATAITDWQRLAMEQLCMILCQTERSNEAKPMLEKLGYVCRLATCVLNYPLQDDTTTGSSSISNNSSNRTDILCHAWDSFLSTCELQHLRDVFEDRNADYWLQHDYRVEPPSPYFSYVVPLTRSKVSDSNHKVSIDDRFGCLGDIILNLYQHLLPLFPQLSSATMVEFWAHNRPHPTGHQFHFDSDNEGQGRLIKNPIMTAIFYLSGVGSSSDDVEDSATHFAAGGPSIVTNQTLHSRHMATKAVMSIATSPGRLVAFDGKLLHGVIPGKGGHSGSRRVTLMLAFWKRIRIRPSETPGAARPYPFPTSASAPTDRWNNLLVRPSTVTAQNPRPVPVSRNPLPLDRVYETLDGDKWTKAMGFPEYDQVYQGF